MLTEKITLELGEKWISSLWQQLNSFRKRREGELNSINNTILFSDPLKLAEVYIEPYCQEINPADRHDEEFLTSKQPLFKKISEFLESKNFQQGNNQLFILSDAGMGKTSSLVMMKLIYLSSFWPKEFSCHLEKIGSGTIEKIKEIENKRKTLLLLDSLDEDPTAYGRTEERLLEILDASKSFCKVIITCRTQFFPNHEADPLEIPGRIKIGPYICPSKYLSIFDELQVDKYLEKRFPKKLIFDKNKEKRNKAKNIVSRMRSLRCRPMLLSFIEDLVDTEEKFSVWSEYTLYKSLVKNWLIREQHKTGIKSEILLETCAQLAFEMQSRKMVKISRRDLDDIIIKFNNIEKIKNLDITGRSLLNRNSAGEYRFSHYSIQEFLVVYFIIEIASLTEERKIYPTDFIKQLLDANSEKIQSRLNSEIITYQNLIESSPKISEKNNGEIFLGETEISSLINRYDADLDNMNINTFSEDFDIPSYLRKIIVKHAKNRKHN